MSNVWPDAGLLGYGSSKNVFLELVLKDQDRFVSDRPADENRQDSFGFGFGFGFGEDANLRAQFGYCQ